METSRNQPKIAEEQPTAEKVESDVLAEGTHAEKRLPKEEDETVEDTEKAPTERIDEQEEAAETEEEEIEVVEERTSLLPLSKARRTSKEKRAPKAVRVLKEYVRRHMKVDEVLISNEVNELIWARGIGGPPRKLRVRLVKDKEGKVTVYPAKGE